MSRTCLGATRMISTTIRLEPGVMEQIWAAAAEASMGEWIRQAIAEKLARDQSEARLS